MHVPTARVPAVNELFTEFLPPPLYLPCRPANLLPFCFGGPRCRDEPTAKLLFECRAVRLALIPSRGACPPRQTLPMSGHKTFPSPEEDEGLPRDHHGSAGAEGGPSGGPGRRRPHAEKMPDTPGLGVAAARLAPEGKGARRPRGSEGLRREGEGRKDLPED